jgi:hypothetical protein
MANPLETGEKMPKEPALSLREGGYCFSSMLLFTEEDFGRIHPDDLRSVRRAYPHGWQLRCFQYGGRQDGYDVLDDGELRIRVRNAYIKPIPEPRFKRKDRVFTQSKQAAGVVREIVWHLKRERVYYLLEFDGRKSGCWYFDGDLNSRSPAEFDLVEDRPHD